jgi:hypothetical protein
MDRYLPDFRQALERSLLEAFVAGNVSLQSEQATRGRLMAAHIVENLNLDQIRGFYELRPLSGTAFAQPRDNEPRGPGG